VIGREWALLTLLALPVPLLRRQFLKAVLCVYATAVIAVTIFPIYLAVPLWHSPDPWWDTLRWIPFVVPPVGFALNIVMFVPFGVLLPLIWPALDSVRRVFWCGLATSATIELTQLAMWIVLGDRRYADVNDLMSNTAGAVLGVLLLQTLARV
jgi:glycopeptide antibiotics resistance protein